MNEQNNNTPRFSIIIPTATNFEGLKKCLESVVKFTDLSQCEIICVANGAPQEIRSLDFPVNILWFDEMIGFPRAINEALKVAKAPYVVLLNDDVILLDQGKNVWLDELYKPFEDPKMGITGPLKDICPSTQREFLLFFCVMIRMAMIKEIGNLDEIFTPGAGEDCDLSHRAVDRGWKIQAVPDEPATWADKGDPSLPAYQQSMWVTRFPLWHEAGCTVGKLEGFQDAYWRNAGILQKRYGVNIEKARMIEGWMADSELEWLGQQARKVSTIVEVGSWAGRSSRAIADNLPADGLLVCVDTFNGSSGEPDAHVTAKEREGDGAYMKFAQNLYDHIRLGRVMPLRMESANAAEVLRNMGVRADMIFLDGDHSEAGFRRDVHLWQPLLKEGGLFCGHDYYLPEQNPLAWVGVRTVVNELFPHAQQAPNTSIWNVKNEPLAPWELLKTYAPVSEPQKGHGGFFSA